MKKLINNFEIIIADTNDKDYVDCLVHELKNDWLLYIDLRKDPRFPIDFRIQPKPIKIKSKSNRWGEVEEVEVPETEEEKIYRTEYMAYENRKEMQMPMWKLHKTTLEKVIITCNNIKETK